MCRRTGRSQRSPGLRGAARVPCAAARTGARTGRRPPARPPVPGGVVVLRRPRLRHAPCAAPGHPARRGRVRRHGRRGLHGHPGPAPARRVRRGAARRHRAPVGPAGRRRAAGQPGGRDRAAPGGLLPPARGRGGHRPAAGHRGRRAAAGTPGTVRRTTGRRVVPRRSAAGCRAGHPGRRARPARRPGAGPGGTGCARPVRCAVRRRARPGGRAPAGRRPGRARVGVTGGRARAATPPRSRAGVHRRPPGQPGGGDRTGAGERGDPRARPGPVPARRGRVRAALRVPPGGGRGRRRRLHRTGDPRRARRADRCHRAAPAAPGPALGTQRRHRHRARALPGPAGRRRPAARRVRRAGGGRAAPRPGHRLRRRHRAQLRPAGARQRAGRLRARRQPRGQHVSTRHRRVPGQRRHGGRRVRPGTARLRGLGPVPATAQGGVRGRVRPVGRPAVPPPRGLDDVPADRPGPGRADPAPAAGPRRPDPRRRRAAAAADPGRPVEERLRAERLGRVAAPGAQPCRGARMRDQALTVVDLLAARAATDPDRVAILLPDGRGLTCREWEERATAVAHGLRARGVRRGDRVGLLFGGVDWIGYAVAYCATQKAGGVAVPLSEKLAPAQLRELLAHCGAMGLVSGAHTQPPAVDVWSVPVDALDGGDPAPHPATVGPDDVAQIVYTSGTTGRPKGVAATHGNLTWGYERAPRQRRFAHSDVFLHAFPIGTNAAQTMLMYALAAHPTALCMPAFDSEGFAALIEEHRAGTVFVVPSMAIDLLNSGAHRRHDLSGVLLLSSSAAALPPAVAAALAEAFPDATLVNYYTSTEAAPAETTMVLDPTRPGSVGRPTNPGDLAVLDEAGDPVPAGAVGEVWLRSPTAPRAYHGDPDGSAATFRRGWVRMGDLGHLDEEGYLFLVDRDGDVITSGGLKVSTLQVEAALYEHPAVAEAAVLGVPHPVLGSAVAAAVVPRAEVTVEELRAFLQDRLGRHQIPTRMAVVAALPRTELGKVVKREVRELFPARRDTPPAPLRSPAEIALGKLWSEVLGVAAVGADDDFFALGGDSLRATQLATLACDTFGTEVTVALVFDAPVLAAQAGRIEAAAPRAATAAGADDGPLLGSTQEYFLRWMHETADRQIQPVSLALRVRDALDVDILERALGELVRRHEMLRAVFVRTGDGFRAEIRDTCAVRVSTVDAEGATLAERERQALALACREVERRFDITRGPLLRALVVQLGVEDQLLVLVVEHLVFDGMSFGVLLRELGLLYSALRLGRPSPLAPLPLTTREFFARTRRRWAGTRDFWRQRLAGAPRALSPFPGHDPAATRYVGRSVEFAVPADAARRLRTLAREAQTTTFMATLAAWCAVLHGESGAPEIVVQTPVTGRTHLEYESLVGCVVQLIMIRIPLDAAGDFPALLRRVRERVIEAADHQVHRFAEVAAMVPYPVHFFFESWGGPAHLPGLASEPVPLPPELGLTWPFADGDPDLSVPRLSLVEYPDARIAGRLLYNAEAFDRRTVRRLADRYVTFIHDLTPPDDRR